MEVEDKGNGEGVGRDARGTEKERIYACCETGDEPH